MISGFRRNMARSGPEVRNMTGSVMCAVSLGLLTKWSRHAAAARLKQVARRRTSSVKIEIGNGGSLGSPGEVAGKKATVFSFLKIETVRCGQSVHPRAMYRYVCVFVCGVCVCGVYMIKSKP
jgi:hypothetical protein